MARKALTFALFALIAITAHAQHFDWAKGYGSSQEGCLIKGTVTDSDGNLYILGQFTKDATWDGQRILPIAPYGPGQNSINTLIAKISPSGEMLWKKVIHSNNNQNTIPYDIKPIGDTAFACMVNVNLPTSDHYCYFLDTLLPSWSDYPIPLSIETTTSSGFTTYMVFDFAGNVLEQHFIQVSYIDTTGNDYVFHDSHEPDKLFSYRLTDPSFDVDADGNIYICRQSSDHFDNMISVEEGSAIGLKFWVDKQCVGTVYVNDGSHPRWIPQMLKFSPHMAALLRSRYVFQNDDARYHMVSHMDYKMKLDRYNNVYSICTMDNVLEQAGTLDVDSLHGIRHWYPGKTVEIGAVVKFDSDLEPGWIVALDDSILNPSSGRSRTLFHDISFDYDSNLLFLSVTSSRGSAIDTTNFFSIPMYEGTPIPVKNEAFVLVLEQTAGKPAFHSYGRVPSVNSSNFQSKYSNGNLHCKNNRVFIQCQFSGGIRFPGNEIRYDRMRDFGTGLIVFDYGGKVIGGISYETRSPETYPGPISLSDSVLYLSICLSEDNATFGEYSLSTTGSLACVAKYIDTAFMTPYVHTEEPGEVSITLVENGAALVAYPNPFRQSVRIKVQGGLLKEHNGTVTAILTDLSGRREEVRLVGSGERRVESGECVYTLDLSSRPQATYLLTLTTADGRQHTIRLLKQSDMFGN